MAKDIKRLVEKTVSDRFQGVRVVSVEVAEDEDVDGDPIIKVRVVFDNDTGKLDARRLSGFLRHLRLNLAEIGEERFPVMSFVSRADAEAA